MRVLSLDTTTRAGSAALVEDGRVVDERTGDGRRTHAERLPGELLDLQRGEGRYDATVVAAYFYGELIDEVVVAYGMLGAVAHNDRATFDAKDLTVRQINLELRSLIYDQGIRDVTVLNPSARHSLGVGILGGCDKLLEPQQPGIITPGAIASAGATGQDMPL